MLDLFFNRELIVGSASSLSKFAPSYPKIIPSIIYGFYGFSLTLPYSPEFIGQLLELLSNIIVCPFVQLGIKVSQLVEVLLQLSIGYLQSFLVDFIIILYSMKVSI